MPNSPVVPTIRRRLGSALCKLRNDAGLTLDGAAAAMGWKAPKMSKVENAAAGIRPIEVTDLLKVYGETNPEVFTALENLARDAGKKGWWQTCSGVIAPAYADYLSLEFDAERVCEWSPTLVPGLLQSAAHAREVIAASAVTRTPEEVAALAEVRMARQAVLSQPDGTGPLHVWAVISEAILHQRFAVRPAAMREQLRRLLDVADMPNVTLQIMPLDATPHPGVAGGFTVVNFPGPMPDVVLVESLRGNSYVEDSEDVCVFVGTFERIVAAALPVDGSLALINRIKEGSPR
ncbi:helix-turn-helix domain-containing protein [Streptomyces sp. NPDC001719]